MTACLSNAALVVDGDENCVVGASGFDAESYGGGDLRCVGECLELRILEEEVVEFGTAFLSWLGRSAQACWVEPILK